MLKLPKGLKGKKSKKKGKKSKHKEEELFKPEELEAYRQKQAEKAAAGGATDDEWKKFQALTSDIDSVLNKTKDDLDRIKSTSFFQRKPTPSEIKQAEQQAAAEQEQLQKELEESDANKLAPPSVGIVELSETESEEEEDEDDIFDTSFVEAVESGEVKLAYIPESPTQEELDGDDPFDTSYAERAILGPAYDKKGKKVVSLGCAVEVLTGRVELPTCAIPRRSPSSRRALQQQKDLLLGSFDADDNGNQVATESSAEAVPAPIPKTILDDDDPLPIDVPIDLSGVTLHQIVPKETSEEKPKTPVTDIKKDILSEFDVLKTEEDDDEFAQLAAESIHKEPVVVLSSVLEPVPADIQPTFEVEFENTPNQVANTDFDLDFEDVDDPFDTTFAENLLPGKAELKLIEDEILNKEEIPDVKEKFSDRIISKVSIHITNPIGERESVSSLASLDRVDEASLNSIKPIHRDLLGGSNTDLSKICDEPIKPNETTEESFSDYSDPFDTSTVDQIVAPGQTELKFLEKELLGDVINLAKDLEDPDFNPRDDEPEDKPHRPEILDVHQPKVVKFVTPTIPADLLGADHEDQKHRKPLTPYYVRENSIPEAKLNDEEELSEVDPFDTSYVSDLAPGKAELKLLEDEFTKPIPALKKQLSDDDFDPRAESETIQKIVTKPAPPRPQLPQLPIQEIPKPDLLAVEEDISCKVLTPAKETADFDLSYVDPFDTSIASNILPGKAELKLLEDELISGEPVPIKRNLTDPEFDPRTIAESQAPQVVEKPKDIEDIFAETVDQTIGKPLTPTAEDTVSFQIGDEDDIDPFDTSIADNIGPGKAELKLLESELI